VKESIKYYFDVIVLSKIPSNTGKSILETLSELVRI